MSETKMDQDGYPCPPLLEPLTWSEFEVRHVQNHPTSTTRGYIFTGYQDYLRDFRLAIGVGFKQWVNGSFTATETNPNDIDVANFVPHEVVKNFEQFAIFQTNGGSRDRYHVDAYLIPIYPIDSPKYIVTLLTANDWAHRFGFNKENGQEKNVAQLLFP